MSVVANLDRLPSAKTAIKYIKNVLLKICEDFEAAHQYEEMREKEAKSDDIALKQEMDKMKTKNIQLEQDLSKATTKINEAATEIMDLKQRLQRAEDKAYQELSDCLAQFVGGIKMLRKASCIRY